MLISASQRPRLELSPAGGRDGWSSATAVVGCIHRDGCGFGISAACHILPCAAVPALQLVGNGEGIATGVIYLSL